ncbi:hypothetical protein LJC12_01100 [Odoribacter sp. OttesenSCG-928-J03]|nr:hypothetical protein [Odoribacter sp. OttesenSCG-928-J03]MDL2282926.1 hypothetical protein [Odoribacter sp. OttesenSCG-928-G04]MDL2330892.1 hypothetical protein [Odoribacter sp. OttesenSCG-928-A06]
MKLFVLMILLLGSCLLGLSQTKNEIEFDLSAFAAAENMNPQQTFEETISEIKGKYNSDIQRLFLICGWFYYHVDFDINKFENGGEAGTYRQMYAKRKGVCEDYARLFSEFCNRLEIKNFCIEGYAPGYNGNIPKIYHETNHMWNVVLLDTVWYHCDLLKVSGYIKNSIIDGWVFEKELVDKYFLTCDPYLFSVQLPADPMWQFLEHPYSMDDFVQQRIIEDQQTESDYFNYKDSVKVFSALNSKDQVIKYANNAYLFNANNHNVIVTTHYNQAVDIYNRNKGNKPKLQEAKTLLQKAMEHLPNAYGHTRGIKPYIQQALQAVESLINR